jgi:hypothetical protein
MRLAFREPCSSHFLVAGGIRLHPRFGRGNIRLATMDAAQADVAIRARGSGGQRLAISLRACGIRETRQQYCNNDGTNRTSMRHGSAITILFRRFALSCRTLHA